MLKARLDFVEFMYLCSLWCCFMEHFYFEIAMGGMELGWQGMYQLCLGGGSDEG